MFRRRGHRLLALLVACLLCSLPAAGLDVVVMKNGDRLTGEIKRLERGQLWMKLKYVAGETVALDWLQVESVESNLRWRVTLEDGTRLTGVVERVPPKEAPGEDFSIEEAGARARVRATEVVEIQRQKRSFWRQLKGSVNLGQSYTSGNGQKSLDVEAEVEYETPKYLTGASFSASVSGQHDAEQTRRYDASWFGGRYLSRNDFVFVLVDFLHSSQQSLDLRTTVGSGYGRYLVRNNHTEFTGFGGLVFTHERFHPSTGPEFQQKNLEGLLGVKYSTFQFNKIEFDTSVQTFPGISDAGRFRSRIDSGITLKLQHDFNLRFGFWDNYDSKPPINAKKNELGVSTTLGVTF
jgi:putative salt-induced outer membrane protein YdiY